MANFLTYILWISRPKVKPSFVWLSAYRQNLESDDDD